MPSGAPRVLEIGAGLGTMVARLLEWDVSQRRRVHAARRRRPAAAGLARLARDSGRPPAACARSSCRTGCGWATCGCGWWRPSSAATWSAGHGEPADLLIANAFLDLVDVPAVLPALLRLLVPGGAYWFTVNFDGETIFQPDHPRRRRRPGGLLTATWIDRVRYGRPAGESRTGRRLFGHLHAAGAPPLALGLPTGSCTPARTVATRTTRPTSSNASCRRSRPPSQGRVDRADLADWLAVRRRQLAAGELVYIAHQLDVAGRRPA